MNQYEELPQSKVNYKIPIEHLKKNEIYTFHDSHWADTEQNYDFLLEEWLHFTAAETLGQPKQKETWDKLKEIKKEKKHKKFEITILTFCKQLLESIEKKKLETTAHKYVELCLRNIVKNYESIFGDLEKTRFNVSTLHQYHIKLLTDKFQSSSSLLNREYQNSYQEYINAKSKWTFQNQDTLVKWEKQYHSFILSLMQWIDAFFYHQKAILLVGGSQQNEETKNTNIFPSDSFQVLQTIFLRTEQTKHQVQQDIDNKEKQQSHSSYITFLFTLYQYWTKIEFKYKGAIENEINQLDKKCQQKIQQMKKEKAEVDKYQESVNYLLAESNNLHRQIIEEQSEKPSTPLNEVQLRSSIALRQRIDAFKPQLKNHQLKLNQMMAELSEFEEKRKIFHCPLPPIHKLEDLKTQESLLLEKHQQILSSGSNSLESLNVQWKQRESLQLEKFHQELARQGTNAHKDRRSCEWQQWGQFEQTLKSIEPRITMLQKNIVQYREECCSLFSSENDFDTLLLHVDEGWRRLVQRYVDVRMETQKEHLDSLIQFYVECQKQLNDMKMITFKKSFT